MGRDHLTITAFVQGLKKVRKMPAKSLLRMLSSRDSLRLKAEMLRKSHPTRTLICKAPDVPHLTVTPHALVKRFLGTDVSPRKQYPSITVLSLRVGNGLAVMLSAY